MLPYIHLKIGTIIPLTEIRNHIDDNYTSNIVQVDVEFTIQLLYKPGAYGVTPTSKVLDADWLDDFSETEDNII